MARALNAQNSLQRFRAATEKAIECRDRAARNPRYQSLDQRMPLTDIGAARLSQMADTRHATNNEIIALGAWLSDIDICRDRLLRSTDKTIPGFGPVIEASWNDDDVVFVNLAHHKVTWGEAIMRLRSKVSIFFRTGKSLRM